MPATFSSLPPELIDCIFDAVDARHDYLALALTYKACSAHIVPEHLALRELVLFDTHTETWDTLDRHPELAACVRSLTLVDSARQAATQAPMSHEKVAFNQVAVRRLLECIIRLPRLKSLCLTSWVFTSVSIPGNPVEGLLGRVGGLECLSLEVLSLSPNTNLYKMRNLRVLELGLSQLSIRYWSDLCNMISQSPRLEVLELPPFLKSYLPTSEAQSPQPLPLLPLLVRFSCAFHEDTVDCSQRLLQFLDSSPTIVELRCKGHPPRTTLRRLTPWSTLTMPELPNLRRIYDRASIDFARAFLRGKPPRSVAFEAFECMDLDDKRALEEYAALDPALLRVLHICRLGDPTHSTDSATRLLELVAQMFPAVEDLHLPIYGTYRGQRKTLWNRKRWPFRHEFPQLTDVAALFPRLRRVEHVGVDVGPMSTEMHSPLLWTLEQPYLTDARAYVLEAVARTMHGIRERFPRLERVNGWLIEDGAEKGETTGIVQLCPARPYEAWRNLSTKYVLTRDGLEKGWCRERGFVSRTPLEATPIGSCSDNHDHNHKSGKLEGWKTLRKTFLARRL